MEHLLCLKHIEQPTGRENKGLLPPSPSLPSLPPTNNCQSEVSDITCVWVQDGLVLKLLSLLLCYFF